MITVVTPCSPIPSHPDTAIFEQTLESVRHHLPESEIVLTFDGVRPEQEDRRADYEEFIRRTLWLADHKWGNVLPLIFDDHLHQTGMMRAALPHIDTPLVMYVESDTPVVTDEPIHWASVAHYLMDGTANLVRFHHEAHIPPEHKHMMHGEVLGLTRTSQWSQRPHVARTDYYRRIMDDHFTPGAKSFIEDKMHGVCSEAFILRGMDGWIDHKLCIYTPEGNIKRSYHLDGRAGGAKFEEKQVF